MSVPAQSIEERISAHLGAEDGPTEAPQQEAPEAVAETPETAPVETSAEAPAEAQETEETTVEAPAEEAAQDAVEYIPIKELSDLAEHIQVDVGDLYNIEIPYGHLVDGQRKTFTLGDVKDKLPEFEASIAAREQAEATYNRYYEAESQVNQIIEQQAQQAATVLEAAQQTLMQEAAEINWQQLQMENPGEWAKQSEKFRQKQAKLHQIGQQAAQQIQSQKAAFEQQSNAMKEEKLQREQQALLRAIPEWRNEETATSERTALTEYMREAGFTADELNNVDDHRALVLARKAMMYDQIKANGDVAQKKVVKIAKKIVKPGARQTAKEAAQGREEAVRKNHLANPKSVDAAADRIQLRIGR